MRGLSGIPNKTRIAPAPPLPPPQIPEEEECTCSLGSREWIDGSIPRRVKKLSWDDESNDNDNDNIRVSKRLPEIMTICEFNMMGFSYYKNVKHSTSFCCGRMESY